MVSLKLIVSTYFIVFIILLGSFASTCVSLSDPLLEKPHKTRVDRYIITEVPYVSQQTNFFCGFATNTMIFNYFQLNTTLEEVLFNSGVGYSLNYYRRPDNRLPYAGWLICQGTLTNKYLADIYGLCFEPWVLDSNLSCNQKWNQYWQYIKKHIVNNTPIVVLADQKILALNDYNLQLMPYLVSLLPSQLTNGHSLVVVGFNEYNNTVCYHDSQYGLYNNSEKGMYRWIDKNIFKLATLKGSPGLWVKFFYNTSESALSKKDAFLMSHQRNIEKLKGNYSLYFKEYPELEYDDNKTYGIQALQSIRNDFQNGLDSDIKTINILRFKNGIGLRYKLINILSSLFNVDFFLLYLDEVFNHIGLEKQYTAMYLSQIQDDFVDKNISHLCKYESALLENESENWTKLGKYYSQFRKKGILLSLADAGLIIGKMIVIIDTIIGIQEKIIAGPPKR